MPSRLGGRAGGGGAAGAGPLAAAVRGALPGGRGEEAVASCSRHGGAVPSRRGPGVPPAGLSERPPAPPPLLPSRLGRAAGSGASGGRQPRPCPAGGGVRGEGNMRGCPRPSALCAEPGERRSAAALPGRPSAQAAAAAAGGD